MATVPGDPNEVAPKAVQPTMADLFIAAAIMDQQGKFKTAGMMPRGVKSISSDRGLGPYDSITRDPRSVSPAATPDEGEA